MRFGEVSLDLAEGSLLAHSRYVNGKKLAKGHQLNNDDLVAIKKEGVTHLVVATLETGDIPEDVVAQRLASLSAGAFVLEQEARTGRSNLIAMQDGLLVIDERAIINFNCVNDALTIATLQSHVPVKSGDIVATVKIIPFSVTSIIVSELEMAMSAFDSGWVRVEPFVKLRVSLIQTRLPNLNENVLDKTYATLRNRLKSLGEGLELVAEYRTAHKVLELADYIRIVKNDCDVLVISSASATTDSQDVIPEAIRLAGGKVERVGMPVDPGNLLVLGSVGSTSVIGMPGCARSPKQNGFDFVLNRLLAGIEVSSADIASMGVGGLLSKMPSGIRACKYPNVDSQFLPRVAVAVLAAGLSQRMGTVNKMLVSVDGEPLVRRVVQAAIRSKAARVIVVLGYQSEAVRAALAELPVEFVVNEYYKEGIGSSVRAAAQAVGPKDDALIYCLGDMPWINEDAINHLITSFEARPNNSIYQVAYEGRKGNPVLWGSEHFSGLRGMYGDQGGRELLLEKSDQVTIVNADTEGVLEDVDTPIDLARVSNRGS